MRGAYRHKPFHVQRFAQAAARRCITSAAAAACAQQRGGGRMPPASVRSRGLSTAPQGRRAGCFAFGEVIFDCFEDGSAVIGGSPLNFAVSLRQLGLDAGMISALGDDVLGQQAREFLVTSGVGTEHVHSSSRPTGKVTVTIVDGEPHYDVDLGASWQEIEFAPSPAAARNSRPELLYIGSTARQTSANANTVRDIVSKLRPVHVLFDLNLRPGMYDPQSVAEGLALATIVKMNGT
jgi:fructokinase